VVRLGRGALRPVWRRGPIERQLRESSLRSWRRFPSRRRFDSPNAVQDANASPQKGSWVSPRENTLVCQESEGVNFAHMGKRRIGLERSTPRPLDDLERKLTSSRSDHDETPPLIRRVGLVVAPAAERDQLIQVEVGAALGALDHVSGRRVPPTERIDYKRSDVSEASLGGAVSSRSSIALGIILAPLASETRVDGYPPDGSEVVAKSEWFCQGALV